MLEKGKAPVSWRVRRALWRRKDFMNGSVGWRGRRTSRVRFSVREEPRGQNSHYTKGQGKGSERIRGEPKSVG